MEDGGIEAYASVMSERRSISPRWQVAQRNLWRIWNEKKKALGLTQEKAGDKMEAITQGAVGQYLRGVISLNERKVLEFAKLLDVHPTEIDPSFNLLPTESRLPANGLTRLRLVPLINRGEIKGYINEGRAMEQLSEGWIPSPVTVGENSFAFRMEGSSMETSIKDGDVVIVDPGLPAVHGCTVLASTTSAPDGIFRRFIQDGGRTYLQAVNPSWPHPIEQAGADVEIIGVAVCTFGWL